MKIHIVNPYESAAMIRMADPLLDLKPLHEVAMSKEVDTSADVNIHVPFHTLAQEQDYGNGKHIAVYTHCNPGMEAHLAEAYVRADLVTAMSFTGRDELLSLSLIHI